MARAGAGGTASAKAYGRMAVGAVLLGGCAVAAGAAHGQQPAAPDSGGYALVLSGGGARGIAHAGVVVALDQLGYSTPVIVGTSMGAIVGALYAAGYAPETIWHIAGSEPWLSGFVPDPLPVGPTRVPLRPLLDIGIGGGRSRHHDGLLPAHGVNLRLVELLFDAGVRARNDFDRLPRRYRAVAADLVTGGEVVLGGFDLPRAVRASMSVPAAFAPVRWHERVLVDGGIANNLPVSVARSLTGLPVIAVDVLRPPDELAERAPLDVGVRALRLLIDNARPGRAEAPDVLIVPALAPGFSEMWFPRDGTRFLRTGFDATVAALPPLRDGRPPLPPGAAPGPLPRAEWSDPPPTLGRVRVEGGDGALNRLVAGITEPLAGEYDAARIIARTRALYATNLFQAIWPRVEFADTAAGPSADAADAAGAAAEPTAGPTSGQGAATLVFDVTPASRSGVALAARWSDDTGAGAWGAVRHRISLHRPIEVRLGGTGDGLARRATLDASVFSTALPGLIWNAGVHAGTDRIREVVAGEVQATGRARSVGAWLGAELYGDWFVSLLGRVDRLRELDPGGLEVLRAWTAGPFLRVTRDRIPDQVAGVPTSLEAELRFGDVAYQRVRASASVVRTAGRLIAAPVIDLAWAPGDAPPSALFATTRELAPWLPAGALRAPVRATAGADLAYPIPLNGFARLRLRAIGAAAGWSRLERRGNWRGGAEIGAAWPTVIGTIEGGVAGGGGEWRLNFGVGR